MIVIGDIHGCYKTFLELLSKLPHDNICLVGDLIDRGPLSAHVVKFVRDNDIPCVLGNHEEFAIHHDSCMEIWLYNGGKETLQSYEEMDRDLMSDIEWFKTLPLYLQYDNKFIVSHSSIFPYWDLDHDSEDFRNNILWNRNFGMPNKMPSNFTNIIGHTPVDEVIEKEHYIMIDRGCVYKLRETLDNRRRLCAYDLDTGKIYEQENID